MFALGDVSTLTPKMASRARLQAQLVADNIRALIDGGQLQTQEPSPDAILVTFDHDGGAAQLPGKDEIAGAETAAQLKSRDMMLDRYAEMFRIPPLTEQSKKVR
jgi:apoptosis-inducing factor 2